MKNLAFLFLILSVLMSEAATDKILITSKSVKAYDSNQIDRKVFKYSDLSEKSRKTIDNLLLKNGKRHISDVTGMTVRLSSVVNEKKKVRKYRLDTESFIETQTEEIVSTGGVDYYNFEIVIKYGKKNYKYFTEELDEAARREVSDMWNRFENGSP